MYIICKSKTCLGYNLGTNKTHKSKNLGKRIDKKQWLEGFGEAPVARDVASTNSDKVFNCLSNIVNGKNICTNNLTASI